ncbi:hypothetical protein F383_22980 [Gossypium arboreum]|uniref:Uncharacterized protein n=1 Tax=Gossypium arboreum TaxID=29729 RepID=A0A0B0NRN8_GOSAR|nr:hypothetical protein F383_22980 [Gossypium arboreum]
MSQCKTMFGTWHWH